MCYEPDGYCDFYESSVVRARKQHKCSTCGAEIDPGQLYKSESGKFDGNFFALKHCGACMAEVYTLHVVELFEGCPDRTSWYPPELARDEMRRHRENAQYYALELASGEDPGEHGAELVHMAEMFERPDRVIGQKYMERLKRQSLAMG